MSETTSSSGWALPPVASVRAAVPPGWWELPLDPETREADIARLVDERLAKLPDRAPFRNRLVALLEETATRAQAAGAVFAAQTAALEDGTLVVANCLVVIRPIGAATGHALLQQLTEFMAGSSPDARCDAVELAGSGPAVRVIDTWQDPADPSGRIGQLSVRYYVPVPGSIDTAILTFSSPQIGLTEVLLAAFDELANQFAFLDATGSPVNPMSSPTEGASTAGT